LKHEIGEVEPASGRFRREVLLDGRRAIAAAQKFDVGGDVMGAHRRERRDVFRVDPGKKRVHGDRVGGAGVWVADVGGEEIEKAQARVLVGVGDQSRNQHRGCGGRPDERRQHNDRERLARCVGLVARSDSRRPLRLSLERAKGVPIAAS
jgi:hypothetical protein